MSVFDETPEPPRTHSGALLAAIAVALAAAIAGLVWCAALSSHLSTAQTELAEARQQNADMAAKLRETDARLRVTSDELGRSLGLTQRQLDERAQAILRREQNDTQQLKNAQRQTARQVASVSSDLSNVKTDVGGVKTNVAKNQSDLANAMSQLQSIRGDLSDHASLIARNHGELKILEQLGQRNYYEFTLNKGHKKPVGTISLELRKADPKHNRFTLIVFSDDKAYEKKNRNTDEPLQFYSGKNPQLFEVVVNSINSKRQVSGYLSTPKSAPVPVTDTGQ